MARKLQIVVASVAFLSAFAAPARAGGPSGLAERVFEGMAMGPRIAAFAELDSHGNHATATAGAVLRTGRNWRARLFVSRFAPVAAADEGLRLRASSTVGAQLSGGLAKDVRLTFDVFNVFDQEIPALDPLAVSRLHSRPGTLDRYLFHPAEPRGFRLTFSKSF